MQGQAEVTSPPPLQIAGQQHADVGVSAGARAAATHRGSGGHWPVAFVCHRLNNSSDCRSPAELDLVPWPRGPALCSLACALPALQQIAAGAQAHLCPSPTGTQSRANPTLTTAFCFRSFGISAFPSLSLGLYKQETGHKGLWRGGHTQMKSSKAFILGIQEQAKKAQKPKLT